MHLYQQIFGYREHGGGEPDDDDQDQLEPVRFLCEASSMRSMIVSSSTSDTIVRCGGVLPPLAQVWIG